MSPRIALHILFVALCGASALAQSGSDTTRTPPSPPPGVQPPLPSVPGLEPAGPLKLRLDDNFTSPDAVTVPPPLTHTPPPLGSTTPPPQLEADEELGEPEPGE